MRWPCVLSVSGNNVSRVFQTGDKFGKQPQVSLSGLTITKGRVGGGSSGGYGGGVHNFGTLTVSNCILTGNSADSGGGICNESILTVSNSSFSGNSAALVGNEADDVLIAGFTDHDANDGALGAVLREWTSSRPYALRVLNLWAGLPCLDRENGNVFLNPGTVHDDGRQDVLTGSAGTYWFLFNQDGDGGTADQVTDLSFFEWLFAADIDFISVDPV